MQTEPFTLKGEVALVTGGATGIGLAIAGALARHGARVVIVGRRQDALDEACAVLGDQVSARNHDVTNNAEAPALMADSLPQRARANAPRAVDGARHRGGRWR